MHIFIVYIIVTKIIIFLFSIDDESDDTTTLKISCSSNINFTSGDGKHTCTKMHFNHNLITISFIFQLIDTWIHESICQAT